MYALAPGILAAAAFAIADVTGKIVLIDGMDVLTLSTFRGLFSIVFLFVWMRVGTIPVPHTPQQQPDTRAGEYADGDGEQDAEKAEQRAAGEQQNVPFAFNFQGIPLMRSGRYSMVFSLDGTPVRRVPFTVYLEPQRSFGPTAIPGM